MVQRNANPLIIAGSLQNQVIIRAFHSDFRNVHSIEALSQKDRGCLWRESLVQQKSAHATRSMLMRSSSTVAAA